MKNRFLCGWVGLACLTGGLRAQEATPEFDPLGETNPGPVLLRVQVEFIEMPHEKFTELMREPRKGADDTALRKQVDDLIGKGEAFVYETMSCMAKSNQRSKSESIEERIYPTEYDGMISPAHGAGKEGERKTGPLRPLGTALETRNTGSTLEIEPVLSENGKLVDLQMTPEIVWKTGDDIYSEFKDDSGDSSVKVPKFYSARLDTSTMLEVGKPQMIGVLSPSGKDGAPDVKRKWMVFVRCEALTVGR